MTAVLTRAPVTISPPRRPGVERLAFGILLVATAALYLANLSVSGWANSFYSAAVQAGSQNWTAWLFGSSDAANAITVDKTPAALWVMGLSARLFGFNSWSVLVPQALMGVASVALLYSAVRRVSGSGAALLAGAVLASTPVAALMFRFNNPDALLVLLLVAAAYCAQRACAPDAGRWWLVAVGGLAGFAFLAKMLQAFLVLPAFAAAYLICAAAPLRTRLLRLGAGIVALVVSGGWYLLLVELWPADRRPFIGGSQTDSIVELALGYNGVGRLTGAETGGLGNLNFDVGWGRLLGNGMGADIGWLLPAALICAGAGFVLTWRAPRTDPTRAALIIWAGWLVVTAAVFSYANGIVHSYYTVALAPAIAACLGIGSALLWRHRNRPPAATALAATVLVTIILAVVLLTRSPDWMPWLRPFIAVVGVTAAALLLVSARLPRPVGSLVAVLAATAVLAGPVAYSVATAAAPHRGRSRWSGRRAAPSVRHSWMRRSRTGAHRAADRRRRGLHLGGRGGRLEQRGRLSTGRRRPGDGRRRVQRHRPRAHARRIPRAGRRRAHSLLHRIAHPGRFPHRPWGQRSRGGHRGLGGAELRPADRRRHRRL